MSNFSQSNGKTLSILPYVHTFSIILIIVFILGIVFNITSIIIILKSKKFKPVNLLMLNLTLSDIVYSIGIPLFVANSFNKSWPFKQTGCQWFFLTDFMGMNVGIWTVTALSVERYIEVTDTKKRMEKISDKFKLFIISVYLAFVWFISFAFYVPIVSSIDAVTTPFGDSMCETTWSQIELNSYFGIKFIFSFVLPFLFILLSSIKLVISLMKWNDISRKHNQLNTKDKETYKTFQTRKTKIIIKGHKAIKIVLSIVVVFFIQWTPLWVFELFKLIKSNEEIQDVHLINAIVSLVAYTNSISNPLLYVCFTHKRFIEKKFVDLTFCCFNKNRFKKRNSIISD